MTNDPIIELCELYDISHHEAVSALREVVGDVLRYKVSTEEIGNNGRLVFYAPKRGEVQKIIHYSPNIEKRVRKALDKKIDLLKIQKMKNEKNKIIRGTILEKNSRGLIVTTSVGKAIVPNQMLLKHEEIFYKIGIALDFHIHKITTNGLILDRKSKALAIHTLKKLLPSEIEVYGINRKYGKRLRVYSNKIPLKTQLEPLKMAFIENIDFVAYSGLDVEKLLKIEDKE